MHFYFEGQLAMWYSLILVCDVSGYDGTVRVWSLPNRTHQFLQQTCIFNRGQEASVEELDGHPISLVCWSSTGKLIAGALDNLVNIWMIGGQLLGSFCNLLLDYMLINYYQIINKKYTSCIYERYYYLTP